MHNLLKKNIFHRVIAFARNSIVIFSSLIYINYGLSRSKLLLACFIWWK